MSYSSSATDAAMLLKIAELMEKDRANAKTEAALKKSELLEALKKSELDDKLDNLFSDLPLTPDEYKKFGGATTFPGSSYISAVERFTWPGIREPKDSELFLIPGYTSSWRESSLDDARKYYAGLLASLYESGNPAKIQEAVKQHERFTRKLKREEVLQPMLSTLPALKPTKTWKPGEIPFETVAEFDQEVRLLAFQSLREPPSEAVFEVVGPCSIMHESRTISFIGMESLKLVAVEEVGVNDNGEVLLSYYLEKTDGSTSVRCLYGLDDEQIHRLFGKKVSHYLRLKVDAVSNNPDFVEMRQLVEQKEMSEKYAGTGIVFGSW